jgi:hypothetical protein
MVGCVTFAIARICLPAIRESSVVVISGPAEGCRSGGAVGQIGICVWPGDGCQVGVWMVFVCGGGEGEQDGESED